MRTLEELLDWPVRKVSTHAVRSPLREPFNAVSHAVGVVAAVVGGTWLVASSEGDPWKAWSFLVFAVGSVGLFTASTLLHAVRAGPRLERRLRRADHAAIFALIAGSYTPITLVILREAGSGWAWPMFLAVWTLAVAGVLFKLVWFDAPRWLSTALYLVLGWMALAVLRPIALAIPLGGVVLLAAGGVLYSVGAVIYALKRPNPAPGVLGYHGLWHLFVLAGWGAHFAMLAAFVLPA